mmetsp:Transcript_21625/g.51237  ORF Transcript_21625/g.51237 Transcript_21625/m.51237 type:complete len:922 (+) Transcript_21625:132-2897(+)
MDHNRNTMRDNSIGIENHFKKKKRRVGGNGDARSISSTGFGSSASIGSKRSTFSNHHRSSNGSVSTATSRSGDSNNRLRHRHNVGIARSSGGRRSTSSNNGFRGRQSRGGSPPAWNTTEGASPHVLCAIGENLARETCVVSLDLSAPFLLNVTKQGNGQSYSETLAYLSVLRPDEVLMNEGRYHSPLARKVLQHFDIQRKQKKKKKQQQQQQQQQQSGSTAAVASTEETEKSIASSGDETTVVKFISRSYFDQTKGADLLRRLARQDTYDSTLVEEYILLSSSHAVLHYTQLTLGAVTFTKHCLDVRVHTGGHNNQRMEIDRSTLLQLELLTNNSHMSGGVGKASSSSSSSSSSNHRKHSLISTMDCTKTSVGHRLLRTTLMAPPCRLDTITARLDLVDTFLHNEDLFYATLQQLQNLTSLDSMLRNIVLVPSRKQLQLQQRKQGGGRPETFSIPTNHGNSCNRPMVVPGPTTATATGKGNTAEARIASKGISGLVCIKSTLASIPVLAAILRNHLDRIESESRDNGDGERRQDRNDNTADNGEDEHQEAREEATIATAKTSLLVGLGLGKGHGSSSSSNGSQSSEGCLGKDHQLLRAIVFALTQPELRVVRDAIDGAFTESTSYTRNANAMKHQECFALKSSDDNGMMDVLRKAFLSNVDDIYKKADEYAEVHGISHVAVKYSTTRGYYLSLPLEMASSLPNEFIQPSKSGKFIFCTTEEVQSLNSRSQDNIQDLLILTHERIQEVLDVARSKYDALARLSDAVALLDLCHGFADKVTLSKLPWARPCLTDGTTPAAEEVDTNEEVDDADNDAAVTNTGESYAIAICNGRYGIDVDDSVFPSNGGPGEWIANDTYASLSKNLTIISGINGSGKSTYLKQIAIIVLLAHCGSYVPAEEALIPLTNRLCARMMTADDQGKMH